MQVSWIELSEKLKNGIEISKGPDGSQAISQNLPNNVLIDQ